MKFRVELDEAFHGETVFEGQFQQPIRRSSKPGGPITAKQIIRWLGGFAVNSAGDIVFQADEATLSAQTKLSGVREYFKCRFAVYPVGNKSEQIIRTISGYVIRD